MNKKLSVWSCRLTIATVLVAAIGLSFCRTASAEGYSPKGKFYALFVWTGSPANGKSFEKMVAGSKKEFESNLGKLCLAETDSRCGAVKFLSGEETTPQNIVDAIGELSAEAGENDALFVYVLSHGFSVNPAAVYQEEEANPRDREHFIAPSAGFDKNGETIAPNFQLNLNEEAIWRSNLLWAMRQHKHRLDFLVTDSCSSPYIKEMRRTEGIPSAPRANIGSGAGVPARAIMALEYILTCAEGTVSWNSSNPLSAIQEDGTPNPKEQELSYGAGYGTNFTLAFIQAASRSVNLASDSYEVEDFFADLGKDYDDIYKEFYGLVRDSNAEGEEGVIIFDDEQATRIQENQVLTTLTAFNTENEKDETNPVKQMDVLLKTNNQVKKTYEHGGSGSGKVGDPAIKESVLKKLTDYGTMGPGGKIEEIIPDYDPDSSNDGFNPDDGI